MRIAPFLLSALFFIACTLSAVAQKLTPQPEAYKNTVRINVTPILVTGSVNSFTLGYERVLKPHLSISANIGHLQLPRIINTKTNAPIQFTKSKENTGFLASADLRFYFKRNRYTAPDGLYWGPYFTYYKFLNESNLNLKENNSVKGTGVLSTDLGIAMAGVQLGYQFVLGKHWTIDFIFMGPGVGFYDASLRLETDVQIDENAEYVQGAYDALVAIFPGAATLLQDREIAKKGSTSFTSAGFRYVLQVGFRF